MVKKLAAIACVFALSMSANAANWIDLGKSGNNNVQTFIDISSIRPYTMRGSLYGSGNYKSAFIQYTYINNNERRKKGEYYTKVLTVADCNQRSVGTVAMITYGFKDQVLDSFENKYFSSSSMNTMFPETVGETILEYMCY